MNRNFGYILAALLVLTGAVTMQRKNDPRLIIANRRASQEQLEVAFRNLGLKNESPEFWTTIIGDRGYRLSHRRQCVFQLLRRHFVKGMTVNELGRLLRLNTWAKPSCLQRIRVLSGKIPIKWVDGDSIFRILVFPEVEGDHWAVYFRIPGDVDEDACWQALLGERRMSASVVDLALDMACYGSNMHLPECRFVFTNPDL